MSTFMFTMPGWERFSTWGEMELQGHLWAQLYLNEDDRDAAPRIWITPPRYVPCTVDELTEAIAAAIAPYEAVPPPPGLIKAWLMDGTPGGIPDSAARRHRLDPPPS